ncbi:IclR family transcriptional regulator [Halobellus captivus]|uniref:IclR family transcriptional regulator n=1 Tax=Halobellus captivus TaxID=2592614 RepID=UPI0011A3B8B4|nr:IclR family transcriptional regulator [Halobellus captivus]
MTMTNGTIKLQSVQRVSEIVELIQSRGPLGATEITEALDVPTSTAHDYLSSLHDLEYLVKTDGKYDIGLRFLDHGIKARDRHDIATVGKRTIKQLARETGEATWLVTEEHGRAVYLDYALGEQAVQTHARIGTRSYLHQLASGKSILAYLPEARVDEIIDRHGLEQRTPHTINTREELFEVLERTRERGYAINDQEAVEGARAIGKAIIVGGEVVGAISVAGPANRLTDQQLADGIIDQIRGATNELELKLSQR